MRNALPILALSVLALHTACLNMDDVFCEPPIEYPALFVWDPEPVSVDPSSTVVVRLSGRVDAPADRVSGWFALQDSTGPLGIAVVECDDLAPIDDLSTDPPDIDVLQPFDARCEPGDGCAVEVCLSFDNPDATPVQADVVVNIALEREMDCGDDPIHEPPGPLRALDAEIIEPTG